MAVKLVITIDSEEDLWVDYKSTSNPTDNIDRIPIVQDLFDRFGAIPTYLITYPVVKNDHSMNIIRRIYDRGRCEIGTHCHPWNTPPFEEVISDYNAMLCNLPYELQYKKIRTLHEAIIDRLGVVPVSFRAGRWGFDSSVARCIHDLGYSIDTSVTPFWDWTGNHGPDFSEAPTFPYFFGLNDILTENPEGCLLEIPPTIGFIQKNLKLSTWVRKKIVNSLFSKYHILGVLARLKLLNFRWLTPELFNGSDMVSLAETFIEMGCPVLNMTFHSVSLLPGRSEFIETEQEFQEFLKNIEMVLQFAVDNGIEFSKLNGIINCV